MRLGAPRRTAWKLGLVGVGMFAFAVFLMPPLYELACELLGINGKNIGTAGAETVVVDESREVTVEFLANVYQDTPLDFRAPSPSKFRINPGRLTEVTYTARNTTDRVLWVQAVHNIVPGIAGKHVKVLQCFCFEKQKFEPGEERKLTFAFTVAPELPKSHEIISVSYTFFKLENPPENSQ